MAKEFQHFLFYHRYILHTGHKPENRFAEGFHQLKIPHFIMGQHVQQAGVTLQIYPQIERPVNNALQVIDTLFKISVPEMQGGNFVVEYQNAVLIDSAEVADAYAREFAQILTFSEPLDWTSDWVAPGYRIGS